MSIFTSKKILIIVGMILMLFIGMTIGGRLKLGNMALPATLGLAHTDQNNKFVAKIIKEIVLENKNVDSESTENKNKTAGDLVKIVRVIDGDTIEIEGGERVRYIGIDTPETVDPRKPVQCFGIEASNKNKELVLGKLARLEKDIINRDKYNRLLRYVWVADILVNLELVSQGFAYAYSYPPDIKYQDLFIKAQAKAREMRRGLWNLCPVALEAQTKTSAPPENSSVGSCFIKGNISSSGEKIYHLPGCGSYEKTKIDKARGEKWFCNESEALALGWRKALNCQ